MEKPCRQISPIFGRKGKTSTTTPAIMAIGNGSTVIDIDRDSGSLNGSLPNGALCSNGVLSDNGALPQSVITKIAIEIADRASAAHAPPKFEPEPFKTVLAVVYVMSVSFLSAFTITYTHDRTPDVNVNPPLPDLVFELVPRMEWAFFACEMCMLFLAAVNIINLAVHKHR